MAMQRKLNAKTKKQAGFVLTSELVLISTILVIGMITGLVTMRDAITAEMEDVAEAIGALDQSYAFDGIINGQTTAAIAGSVFDDDVDVNAGDTIGFSFTPASPENGPVIATPGFGAGTDAPGTVVAQ